MYRLSVNYPKSLSNFLSTARLTFLQLVLKVPTERTKTIFHSSKVKFFKFLISFHEICFSLRRIFFLSYFLKVQTLLSFVRISLIFFQLFLRQIFSTAFNFPKRSSLSECLRVTKQNSSSSHRFYTNISLVRVSLIPGKRTKSGSLECVSESYRYFVYLEKIQQDITSRILLALSSTLRFRKIL